MSDFTWDELLAHAQPGETFTQGDPKDEAVLTARHLSALRAVENEAAENEAALALDTVDTTDATESTDANGSPVSDAAPDAAPTRKRK